MKPEKGLLRDSGIIHKSTVRANGSDVDNQSFISPQTTSRIELGWGGLPHPLRAAGRDRQGLWNRAAARERLRQSLIDTRTTETLAP